MAIGNANKIRLAGCDQLGSRATRRLNQAILVRRYDSGGIGFDQNTQSLLGLFRQSAFVHKVGDEEPNARQRYCFQNRPNGRVRRVHGTETSLSHEHKQPSATTAERGRNRAASTMGNR